MRLRFLFSEFLNFLRATTVFVFLRLWNLNFWIFWKLTLHYITLQHITTLHYITLHYISSHHITLQYITSHHITSHYITHTHTYIHACMHACMHAYIHSTIMIDYVELHNKRYIIKNSKHKWPVDQQMQYPGKLFRGKQFKPYLIAWKFLTRRETASSCLKSFVCELHGAVSETKRKKRQREDNTKAAQRPTQSEALRIASWCFNGKLWKVEVSVPKPCLSGLQHQGAHPWM